MREIQKLKNNQSMLREGNTSRDSGTENNRSVRRASFLSAMSHRSKNSKKKSSIGNSKKSSIGKSKKSSRKSSSKKTIQSISKIYPFY